MTEKRRSAGRPKRGQAVITPRSVGEATVASLKKDGAAGLSLSRIAAELDVRSQSLYHHISTVTDAVNAARSVLLEGLEVSFSAHEDWKSAVTRIAEEYYLRFAPLEEANGIFFVHEISDSTTLSLYESFLSTAISHGIKPNLAMALLLDIEHTIFAIISERTTVKSIFQEEAIKSGDFPNLERLLEQHSTGEEASIKRLRTQILNLLKEAESQSLE